MTQYGICGTNLISINITGDIYLICKPTILSICSTLSERFAGQGERVEVRKGDNFHMKLNAVLNLNCVLYSEILLIFQLFK